MDDTRGKIKWKTDHRIWKPLSVFNGNTYENIITTVLLIRNTEAAEPKYIGIEMPDKKIITLKWV